MRDLRGAVATRLLGTAVGKVLGEVTRPVQRHVHHDGQDEQGADGQHRDPDPALPLKEAPQRRDRRTPVRPDQGDEHGKGDHRDKEQETRLAVDEEPPGQGENPRIAGMPGRDRPRRDHEDAVRRDVHVGHPVGVDRLRMHGGEDEDDRQAGRRAAQRAGPAVDNQHGQRHYGAAEREDGEHMGVPRGRHHVQPVVEQPLPERLRVHIARPRMVETLAGVVADQQGEVHRLLDQDRVRGRVTALVEAGGEQEPAADGQRGEQNRERHRPDPPGTTTDPLRPGRDRRAPGVAGLARLPVPDGHASLLACGAGYPASRCPPVPTIRATQKRVSVPPALGRSCALTGRCPSAGSCPRSAPPPPRAFRWCRPGWRR